MATPGNNLWKVATSNAFNTTLNGNVQAGDSSITLSNTSGLNATGGVLCIDRQDGNNTDTPNIREYIAYTAVAGFAVTGCVRGLGGSTAQPHSSNAKVEECFSVTHWNDLISTLLQWFSASGTITPVLGSDATGDMYYKASNGTLSRLGIGSTGQSIVVAGGLPTWGTLNPVTKAWANLTDGATITLDMSVANTRFKIPSMAGSRTLQISNYTVGDYMLEIEQDSTGSRLLTIAGFNVAAITMTIANPCVVTLGKDIPTTTPIQFTTTGALPTGITASTTYYWVRTSSTQGNLALSIANAQAGTTITTSGSQSGTHAAQIMPRFGTSNTAPTLTTGKYRHDLLGISVADAINGIVNVVVMNQDY